MEEVVTTIRTRSRRIPAAVVDAAEEVRRLREDAAREASELVAAARAEAEVIRSEAAARGREEGLARVSELCARAAALRDELLAASEAELVELAFGIAARVLARAVERDPAAVVEVAAQALEAARRRVEVTLRAHPEDIAALRAAEPKLLETLERVQRIAICEDPVVGRGGVVVETEVGTIDGRLDAQLAALRRAVGGGRRSARLASRAESGAWAESAAPVAGRLLATRGASEGVATAEAPP